MSMVVQVHGFNWETYAEHIMPAFEQWLIQRDESAIYKLFKETRCAREEIFIPAPLQRARIWPRAKAFAATLPLGPYSRREYQKLCSAEHFTLLSDRYMYKHAPQLYQTPEPIRTVWGALIETYCLPWSREEQAQHGPQQQSAGEEELPSFSATQVERSEVLALLHEAGLSDLAREMSEQGQFAFERLRQEESRAEPETQPLSAERTPWRTGEIDFTYHKDLSGGLLDEESDGEIEEYTQPMPGGVLIGSHPNTLQLRGWLASISVRALALFEYLACGRRSMPFGYEPSEPYGVFIGYLTPDEVWRLGTCLRGIRDPEQAEAEADYLRFRYQHPGLPETARLIDEILPSYAADFHQAVDMAAAQGLGLICSIE
ncbi:MAG TPA: hypothetical protein VFV38_21990 [Ktedonobacteraceae bacterium]|nr:hypothetical protein [Ktedonobacteraceae bacterium]